MKRLAPLCLLALAACDLDALLRAALAGQDGPYGEGPLEVQTASLTGTLAGDRFEVADVTPSGGASDGSARVELRVPGRDGFGMVFVDIANGGLEDPALAPGNEYTLNEYEELRPGGPVMSMVGCWATREDEPWSYDAHASEFHVAVEPGERPDEVLYRVRGGLPYESQSQELELTFLARRALTEEQQAELEKQRQPPEEQAGP